MNWSTFVCVVVAGADSNSCSDCSLIVQDLYLDFQHELCTELCICKNLKDHHILFKFNESTTGYLLESTHFKMVTTVDWP